MSRRAFGEVALPRNLPEEVMMVLYDFVPCLSKEFEVDVIDER